MSLLHCTWLSPIAAQQIPVPCSISQRYLGFPICTFPRTLPPAYVLQMLDQISPKPWPDSTQLNYPSGADGKRLDEHCLACLAHVDVRLDVLSAYLGSWIPIVFRNRAAISELDVFPHSHSSCTSPARNLSWSPLQPPAGP